MMNTVRDPNTAQPNRGMMMETGGQNVSQPNTGGSNYVTDPNIAQPSYY